MSALACPTCGETESLATTERLYGAALCNEITAEGPEYEGYTEMDWDSSTTVGVECGGCGWAYRGADWLDQLVVPGPEAE